MRRKLLTVIGLLVCHAAFAQVGYFQGVTPRPPDVYPLPASLTVTRMAPAGGIPNVVPALYTHVTTQPATQTYEWANLTILNNPSNFGANVASYSQAQKTGRGTTWAGVFELQDATGRGGFHALEVDAFTTGPSPSPGSMDGDRIGIGVIVGRAFDTGPKATLDYGVFVAPSRLKDDEADVNFGMMVWTQCRFACYAMRAGNKIAYEESGAIASKFDPQTGRWGLYNGDQPLFEVDVATGELRVNGRPVEVKYKD
jgi:hypothetical protein